MGALTDTAVRKAKPQAKPFKLSDQAGLYVFIKPNGAKLWRRDFQLHGKRKTMSFGQYPAVTLAEARKLNDEAGLNLKRGDDPVEMRKTQKNAEASERGNTFDKVSDLFLKRCEEEGQSPSTLDRKRRMLKNYAKKAFGDKGMRSISAADVLEPMQRLAKAGKLETAHRLKEAVGQVFRLAIALQKADNDPTLALKGAIQTPVVTSHPGLTQPKAIGALMSNIDDYDGWATMRYVLQFIALTIPRPVEARKARWDQIDFNKRIWAIPAKVIKMRRDHKVPLVPQTIDLLKEIQQLTGNGAYIFPQMRSVEKPISENGMNSALRRMGYDTKTEHCSHGFRTSFSTRMNEDGFDPEVIEVCLAHVDSSTRGIYNRAEYWQKRVDVMQAWADKLGHYRLL